MHDCKQCKVAKENKAKLWGKSSPCHIFFSKRAARPPKRQYLRNPGGYLEPDLGEKGFDTYSLHTHSRCD